MVFGLVAVLVVSLAFVVKWGIYNSIGPSVPDAAWARVVVAITSMVLASFAVAAGVFLLFPAVGLARGAVVIIGETIGNPRRLPTADNIRRIEEATRLGPRALRRAVRDYCLALRKNAEAMGLPDRKKYDKAFEDGWTDTESTFGEVIAQIQSIAAGWSKRVVLRAPEPCRLPYGRNHLMRLLANMFYEMVVNYSLAGTEISLRWTRPSDTFLLEITAVGRRMSVMEAEGSAWYDKALWGLGSSLSLFRRGPVGMDEARRIATELGGRLTAAASPLAQDTPFPGMWRNSLRFVSAITTG
jgi:hypothetical protein